MIKVLHLITGLEQGGAETMLYKLLSKMDHQKFESIVVSMQNEGVFGEKIKALGISVYCLNISGYGLNHLSAIFTYRKILQNFKPDVIQTWMYHANVFGYLASFFTPKTKFCMNIRCALGFYDSQKWTTKAVIKLNAILSHDVDAVINNSFVSEKQHQAIGFSNKNSVWIPNGIDCELFKPFLERSTEFKKTHYLSAETNIIGMFARFHPEKNQAGFLDVAAELMRRNNQAWRFVLAGTGCDSNNATLVKMITARNLTQNVILLGSVNVADTLPCLDVYLSTSISEGFPNVLAEAMACSVPCVATAVGDCARIIDDHGGIAALEDIVALADCCERALRKTDAEKQAMRDHVVTHYAIADVVKHYEQLYQSLMEK